MHLNTCLNTYFLNTWEPSRTFNNFIKPLTFWTDSQSDDSPSLFENRCETCLHAFEFEDQDGAMSENKFRDSIKFFFQNPLDLPPETGPTVRLRPILILSRIFPRQSFKQITILDMSPFTNWFNIQSRIRRWAEINNSFLRST
jgi:hypothetical protein